MVLESIYCIPLKIPKLILLIVLKSLNTSCLKVETQNVGDIYDLDVGKHMGTHPKQWGFKPEC